jgi:hypothetical protein
MPTLALHEVFKLRNSVAKFRYHFLVFIHNVASVDSKNDAVQNAPTTI